MSKNSFLRDGVIRRRRQLLLSCLICLVLFLTGLPVMAETVYQDSDPDDYITERFDVTITTTKKHVFHVKEEIDVNFIRKHHGIERYIPFSSKLYEIRHVRVKGGDVSRETTTYREDGYQVGDVCLRIGDEDKLLSGQHSYVIRYDIVCHEDDDAALDYLSIDLLPTGWGTSIREAEVSLTLPADIDPSAFEFYSGGYGETGEETSVQLDDYSLDVSDDGREIRMHVTNNPAYSGVTVNAELPQGYWVRPKSNRYAFSLLVLLLIACPLLAAVLWLLFGRDPQVVKTVEFYPPEDMTPAELGYVIDGYVDKGDMSSMLMYYAGKGYLGIHEKEKDKYEVRMLKKLEKDSGEKDFARTLFNGIFSKGLKKDIDGEKVRYASLNSLPSDYGKKLEKAKSQLEKYYDDDKALYTDESMFCRAVSVIFVALNVILANVLAGIYSFEYDNPWMLILVLPCVVIGMALVMHAHDVRRSRRVVNTIFKTAAGLLLYLLGWIGARASMDSMVRRANAIAAASGSAKTYDWIGWLLLASMAVTLFFAVFMRARTKQCSEWLGKILGFRDFVRSAEIDRLRVLQDSDPHYFYTIMPYAYVMGLGQQWAKKFTDIKMEKPDWFSTYRGGVWVYSPLWYSDMTRTASKSYSSGFGNMPDSGSHGSFGGGGGSFGGGGFSGGGFGGGGGGAW